MSPGILADMRARIAKLAPFRYQVRPSAVESFAPFIDGEMRRLAVHSADIDQALRDLDARLADIGA